MCCFQEHVESSREAGREGGYREETGRVQGRKGGKGGHGEMRMTVLENAQDKQTHGEPMGK